jgi:hypothetical protein
MDFRGLLQLSSSVTEALMVFILVSNGRPNFRVAWLPEKSDNRAE